MRHPKPDPAGPGQESVWDYPRPAIAEASGAHILIAHCGITLADTRGAVRTLETSHPPTYYLPQGDLAMRLLDPAPGQSLCEWKGQARYWTVVIGDERFERVGWSYADPTSAFAILRDHIAFYAAPFDEVRVDGEQVVPQQGDFYGGWVTSDLAGPFKGVPGSRFW